MDLVPLAPWSAFFMLVTAVLCLIGLLSKHYRDNLFQCVAMGCGLIGCSSRFADLLGRTDIPLDWFLVHACLGLFAMGTAWKVLWHLHRERFGEAMARMRARQHEAEMVVAQLHEHDHIL